MMTSLAFLSAGFVLLSFGYISTVNGDSSNTDGKVKMSFKPPELNEEESHSQFISDDFKCDACLVVAYQVISHIFCASGHRCSQKMMLWGWFVGLGEGRSPQWGPGAKPFANDGGEGACPLAKRMLSPKIEK